MQAPNAPAPLDRIVFRTQSVTIGAFRCPLGHPRFEDSGPIAQHCLVFPRTAVSIEHEHAPPLIANPNVVTLYNRGQRYLRGAISRDGDRCEWFGLDAQLVRDVLARFDPSAADRAEELFTRASGSCDAALYLAQRRVFELAHSGAPVEPLALEECVLGLLERVCELASEQVGAALEPARRGASTHELERILSERWSEPLQLSDLAHAVGLSIYHMCRSFRRETGTTLHQYRHQLRLRSSLEPLRESSRPLVELALQCGFSSHSHYTSAFRREFGTTPSRLRDEHGSEEN
ncbi:MAG: helix-turn-helix transcriptional regulator [Planctomycetes bacterium]|nr:helix-turn-helix transcriptional regulator [Planctomycetota bacterium]